MIRQIKAILGRDLKLAWRLGGGASVGLIFFLSIGIFVPFAIGPDPNILARIAPAIVWIGALLATLLGLDRLFQADHEDGSLDLIHGSGLPLELFVIAKVLAHWLGTGLPLILATPVLGTLLSSPASALWPLMLALLAGTPALSFLGAVGAAATISLKRGGLLLAVLVLPLASPILIFGVGFVSADGLFPPAFLGLCGLGLLAAVTGTFAAAAALRAGLE